MKPKINNYRFFVGRWQGHILQYIEVFPANSDQLKIQSVKEKSRIFFRKKLSGNPILINTDEIQDYSLIKTFESIFNTGVVVTYYFKIQRKQGSLWTDLWVGTFNIVGCRFDDDRCTVEITDTEPDDQYRCLLAMTDKKFNLYDINNIVSCKSVGDNYSLETRVETATNVTCTGTVNGNCFIPYLPFAFPIPTEVANPNLYGSHWIPIEQIYTPVDLVNKIFNLQTTWTRGFKYTLDNPAGTPIQPAGAIWVLDVATTLAGLPAHKWLVQSSSLSILSAYTSCLKWWMDLDLPVINYTRNRTFISAIEQIIAECGLTFYSDFLNDSINPVTQDENKLNHLLITGKSDAKAPASTEPQTIAEYTFKNIESWLKAFNAYWYIENGVFYVVHWSEVNKIVGRNLKLVENGRYIKSTNKYEYDSIEINSRERMVMMEQDGIDFIGTDIYYTNIPDDKYNVNTISIDYITTDLGYIETFPADISSEGFCLMACKYNQQGDLVVINEIGQITGNVVKNGHLSIANLEQNYHRYNREFIKGTMNNVQQTFITSRKIKKQIDVQFPLCAGDTLDEMKLITTNLGNGEISEAEFDLKSDMQKVTLIY